MEEKGMHHVYAFNEAMCEGRPIKEIDSHTFFVKRANAYHASINEYYDKHIDLIVDDKKELHLYFDADMLLLPFWHT